MAQHSVLDDIQVLMTPMTSQRDKMSMMMRQNSNCMYFEDRLCKKVSYQMQRTMSHHLKSELMLSEMSHNTQVNRTMYTEVTQKLLLNMAEVQGGRENESQCLTTNDCRCGDHIKIQ